MCGITGIITQKLEQQQKMSSIVKQMTKAIRHRGPDGVGYLLIDWQKGLLSQKKINMCFGHRRLSILDLSKKGHQPMANHDKTLWIIFNGEIYNYLELREKLIKKGYSFRTNTDTEVILAAFEEWNVDCFNKFNGMWALAIYDKRNKRIIWSRDRFGIKPFYYYQDDKKTIFASEIKAILQYPKIQAKANMGVVYDFLLTGAHDHTDQTFFEGIKRLPPASYAIIDKKGMSINYYWKLEKQRVAEHIVKSFLTLFKDSIRLRLRSDVPVGTCLSGGIDSSSIVCMLNKLLQQSEIKSVGKRQKTFSACFENKKIDERPYIEKCIKETGAEKNYIFPNAQKLWQELPKLMYVQEEPFGSTSIYAQYNVMRLASKKVKVLLDGQGADELLGGYIPYFKIYVESLLRQGKFLQALKEVVKSLDLTFPFLHKYFSQKNKRSIMQQLLKGNFSTGLLSDAGKKWNVKNFEQALWIDFTKWSLPHLLRYEDKNSMAFSIEARLPFLDYRLVEYIFSLSDDFKIRNGWTKYVLREAMEGILPEKIRRRRNKIGFATPESTWLKELTPEIKNFLSDPRVGKRAFFNQTKILEYTDQLFRCKQDDYDLLWRIIITEMWMRRFIDENITLS